MTGYSTKYIKKSKRGKSISINDDVVYLDGRRAPTGYKWYDASNKATYRVGKDGKFSVIQIKGKPVGNYVADTGSPRGNGKYFSDRFSNDDLKRMANDRSYPTGRVNANNGLFMNNRLRQEDPYFIPTYLPNVPTLHVSTGKLYRGVDISANALDSIAKYARQYNIPLNEAFGLTHENTFNKVEPGMILQTKDDYNREAKKGPSYEKRVDGRMGYYPTDLMNNFNYYTGNPYQGIANELINKGYARNVLTDDSNNYDNAIWRYVAPMAIRRVNHENEIGRRRLTAQEIAGADDFINYTVDNAPKNTSSNNPYINAFDYYKNNNYGMGSGYPKRVVLFGNELLADPAVSNYLRQKNIVK